VLVVSGEVWREWCVGLSQVAIVWRDGRICTNGQKLSGIPGVIRGCGMGRG
jgi:hypothetical protein